MLRAAIARSFLTLTLLAALVSPVVSQQNRPGPPDGRPTHEPREVPTPLPLPIPTPIALPTPPPLPTMTLPPVGLPTTGPRGARTFLRGVLGPTIPLRNLPPLPATPANLNNGLRHIFAANGATMNANALNNGTCTTTVGTVFNIGCNILGFSSDLPAGTYQDYIINATSATAATIGGTYAGGNNDPGWTTTLSNQGTYVLAALNTGTGTWDAVTYIISGTATVFGTFSDASLTVPSTQFVAKNTSTVYINITGLTPTDYYEVYVEFTSAAATCVFTAPAEVPAPGANTLCNPTNSAGQTAPGGTITQSWTLSAGLAPGTYSIVLYDKTAGRRLAQRQIVLTKNGASTAITLTPTSTVNASPNPAPAGTPTTTIAFNGSTDAADSGFTAAASGLVANRSYTVAISDPNGTVTAWTTANASGIGTMSIAYTMSQARAPFNYIGHTYTYGLLDNVLNSMGATQSYKIVGYNVLTQFTSPLGASLVLPSGGSTVSGLIFTNDSQSQFGVGNGDPISKIQWNTYTAASGVNGITITLGAGSTSCGATCQTQTVTDSTGQSWVFTSTCGGAGVNQFCNMIGVPSVAGKSLPVGATVSIPNITFNNTVGNACSTSCAASTTMLPLDGLRWSTDGDSSSSNPVYFTNGFGTTYAATAHMILYGERAPGGGLLTVGPDAHSFTPRFNQALYASNQPVAAPANQNDVFALTFKNTSSAGTVTNIEVTLPTAFSPSSTTNFIQIDPASPTSWTVQIPCPNGATGPVFCLAKSGANAGIAAGATQTIYFDVSPPPANAFSYSDMSIQALQPAAFTASADGTATPFVPNTTPVDTLAFASYSLDSTLITPLFTPTSEGTNTNNNVTISVQNTGTGASPYPDYLDLIAIDIPTVNTLTNITPVTANWLSLGTSVSGSNTRYWFGLCAAQFNPGSYGPPSSNIPPAGNCGAAVEQNSIAPGATFSFTANIQTQTSNITATEYAHGANGNGWSAARTFPLTVTAVSAVAGFKSLGTYGSPTAVTSNTQPTIGADSDTTYGNSYVYEIKNTGSNPITSVKITIPSQDTGSVNATDAAGQVWQITSGTPTLSGSGSAGCSVTGQQNGNSAGTPNGFITISGCNMAAGTVLDVSWAMKAPYNINSNYQFGTVVNGAINASEAWFSDTIIKVVLTGAISIAINPSNPGPGGSTPTVVCPTCAFNVPINEIQFGTFGNNTTTNFTDVNRVSVYTDAGTTNSWTIAVSTTTNPANSSGSPTNELLTSIDSANSTQGSGMIVDQTTMAVIPTSGTLQIAHGPTGITPRRLPFDLIQSFRLAIGPADPLTPVTSPITYTFIAN